jgi:hypothetical protein
MAEPPASPRRRLPPLELPETKPARRRSEVRVALLVIVLLGIASGLVGGTSALFSALTTNTGFIATPSLAGPNGALSGATGGGVVLTWTAAGNLLPGNEYQVYRSNTLVASAATCPTNGGGTGDTNYTGANGTVVGFTNLLTLTDTAVLAQSSTTNQYDCYMLFGAYTAGAVPSAPVWLSHPIAVPFNPIVGSHLPLVVSGVDFYNNSGGSVCIGANCSFDALDVIQLTFNQPTNQVAIAGNTDICISHTTGKIYIGTTTVAGSCSPASGQVGEIDPPASCVPSPCFTFAGAADADYNGAYVWNPSFGCPYVGVHPTAGTVLCLGGLSQKSGGTLTVKSVGWTFIPSTAAGIKSGDAVVANRVPVCTAVAACQPTTPTEP